MFFSKYVRLGKPDAREGRRGGNVQIGDAVGVPQGRSMEEGRRENVREALALLWQGLPWECDG